MDEKRIQEIVARVAEEFRTFGGGRAIPGNPIAAALKDRSPVFAADVSVEDVVRFVIRQTAS